MPARSPVERRYDRVARFYDLLESPMEWRAAGKWRLLLFDGAHGDVLEVGVGTGKNIPFYPPGLKITAVDLSERMLAKARERAGERARKGGADVDIRKMDIEHLDFPDRSFDLVVASFVFCSVPDPVAGLREIRRVLRPDGELRLIEHVLLEKQPMRAAMNLLDPLTSRVFGFHINRRTCANVRAAGFTIVREENLSGAMFKLIIAKPGKH